LLPRLISPTDDDDDDDDDEQSRPVNQIEADRADQVRLCHRKHTGFCVI
jgi:hypothetical protein